MDTSKIKKVHVVYKTHLDVGFTDLGKTVLERYRKEYIPHSIDLAFELNSEKEKKFIWTLGSYLIDDYLKNADSEEKARLETAIKRGDICWHGLACTTHTELLDEELFDFNLGISDKLDERFGKKTIAAKMTDVPGHTKAMVKHLADHGKQYLHLGVNPSSMVPGVPMTFVWRSEGRDIIVQYSFEYGAPCYVEGMEEVLEFAHTGDNLGPQSAEAIEAEMARIQAIYPNAKVEASTMDAYAEQLLVYKAQLPVVEEEIGDTWIHGIASDPLKVMRYRALVTLKNKWEQEGRFSPEHVSYEPFLMNLLLVAEHTWGLDYKKYLADFTNWEKKDFQAARKADVTTLDFLTNRNANMLQVLKEDFKKYRGGEFHGSYAFYESSHEEQMEYIFHAVRSLPEELAKEAEQEFIRLENAPKTFLKPASDMEGSCAEKRVERKTGEDCRMQEEACKTVVPYEHVTLGSYEAAFGGNGALIYLAKDGKEWITDGCFGQLGYTTYNAADCVNNYYRYNRAFRQNQSWSEGDFSKPGLEFVEHLEHREYDFGAVRMERKGQAVSIWLHGSNSAAEAYGCPRQACIRYEFADVIKCCLSWQEKDANRMPEALWFDMNFDVENPYRWRMRKMGQVISPVDVAKGGNRRQHCVEEMCYEGADGHISVKNIHAPLISVGGRWLYGDYRTLPDVADGYSYCLFNNKWGTNFKMWCEDDCTFEFEIDIENA